MLVIYALRVGTTQNLYICYLSTCCGAGFRSQLEKGWRKALEHLYLNSSFSPGPVHMNQSCKQNLYLSIFACWCIDFYENAKQDPSFWRWWVTFSCNAVQPVLKTENHASDISSQ